jgi:acetylornithine deacetylase/succinyl-diaminopimelate desuccinylase-like protein
MASNLSFPSNLFMRLLKIPIFTNKVLKLFGAKGDAFDPLLHNTVNVMSIHGGEQIYGIPSKIEIILAATLLPGYNADDIIAELKKIIGDEFEYEVLYFVSVPHKIDMGLFDTLKDILHKTDPEGVALPILMSGVTDGRFFSKLGIQTYGFIPMSLPEEVNFIQLFHNANERIPVEAIEFGADSIYELFQCFK